MSSNAEEEKKKDDDEARATEWPVYHWDKVEHSDDHGLTARSGTGFNISNQKIDDAKPVKPPDAVKKLKKDKKAMMRRIEQQKAPKGGKRRKRTRGKLRAKSRAKSRKKRRKKRRKSRRRKRRRKNLKKRTKRRR